MERVVSNTSQITVKNVDDIMEDEPEPEKEIRPLGIKSLKKRNTDRRIETIRKTEWK